MIYLNVNRTEESDDCFKFKSLEEAVEFVLEELEVEEDFTISTTPINYDEKDYILIEESPER